MAPLEENMLGGVQPLELVSPVKNSILTSEGKILEKRTELSDVLTTFNQTFVLSDATKPDIPIVFASEGFYKMTGYSRDEVIGKNCRFLQGQETDKDEVSRLKQCLMNGEPFCGRLYNYRKDGTPFWNLLTISPVKNEAGKVIQFIGMQVEVSKHTEGRAEDKKRPNDLPVSLIRYDARQREEAEESVTEIVHAVKRPDKAMARLSMITGDMNTGRGSIADMQKNIPLSELTSNEAKQGAAAAEQAEDEGRDSFDITGEKAVRRGLDLATTLERIQKNFVITDPRLPENPIIFASDDFLELTEFSREEIIGRNCRFLQGPGTDMDTVQLIRDAIREQRDVTVQLLNYTKSGKPFWNLFHLQAVKDSTGQLQYFIGVQLDASEYKEPLLEPLSEVAEKDGIQQVISTAVNVGLSLKELPDPHVLKEDIWAVHSSQVFPKPHRRYDKNWEAILKVQSSEGSVGLRHFKPVRPLGCGDTGSVHLVELKGSGRLFAMKAMDKGIMVERNKVHRACTERRVLGALDHPFLPTLYASFQTGTHVCLITEYCPGGELFTLLERQPSKRFPEHATRFFAAEILLALEALHCQGVVYRDLKPENILVAQNGHLVLTDFDLSFVSEVEPELVYPNKDRKKGNRKEDRPVLVVKPSGTSNSFVGTEEYIAPEIISGAGHCSQVDWWAFGIFIFELMYGRTPFRGRNRQRTFTNILNKELVFPSSIPASQEVKDLMEALLTKNSEDRLGFHFGASEIKMHPFFKNIDWALIRCRQPPELEVPVKFSDYKVSMDFLEEEQEWDEDEARSVSTVTTSDYDTEDR
uniref:non-specific serine/threonine protein kinase n=1 Tax=Mougeotia sp. BC-2016 TaxID=1799600 RepID=A0A140F7P2_9VIRI|nr:putative LOV domain-containing protein [Mougeotia sp. BC-2016]